MTRQTIAITGAAGSIGRVLRSGLAGGNRNIRLIDIAPLGEARRGETIIKADLTDFDWAKRALEGVDVLIHLAANIKEGPWETLFPLNYTLTYNAFEAARLGGAKRIIFPSSVQAVGFHPAENPIGPETRIRPTGFYGAYKAWGEAMTSLYVDKHDMTGICLRIASFHDKPVDRRMLRTWLSHRDAVRLFEAATNADVEFITVYGHSANSTSTVRDPNWAKIGYDPKDDAETYRAEVEAASDGLTEIGFRTHGGDYASVGYTGDGEAYLKRE